MPTNRIGLFLETTSVLDVNDIDIKPENFKDFIVKLTHSIGNIQKAVNLKDTGIYSLTEFVCGKTFFPSNLAPAWASVSQTTQTRQVYRKEFLIALFGGIPIGDSTYPHNLNINPPAESIWSMTDIYGTTNDIINRVYYPLPFVGTAGNSISIWVDANDIHIDSTAAQPNFQLTYITLEYLKF